MNNKTIAPLTLAPGEGETSTLCNSKTPDGDGWIREASTQLQVTQNRPALFTSAGNQEMVSDRIWQCQSNTHCSSWFGHSRHAIQFPSKVGLRREGLSVQVTEPFRDAMAAKNLCVGYRAQASFQLETQQKKQRYCCTSGSSLYGKQHWENRKVSTSKWELRLKK